MIPLPPPLRGQVFLDDDDRPIPGTVYLMAGWVCIETDPPHTDPSRPTAVWYPAHRVAVIATEVPPR